MIDLSRLTATQILVLKAVAEFDCGNLSCKDCPFNTVDDGCGSMQMQRVFYNERRERDKN